MRLAATLIRSALACGLVGIVPDGPVDAALHRVPGEFPVLQDAIDASADGDTVLVAPGTYTGPGNKDLDFGGIDLVLRAEAGPEETVIDCEETGIGVTFRNGETRAAKLEGIAIRNAEPSGDDEGAITCFGAGPTIEGCVIASSGGSGIYSLEGAFLLVDATISGCRGAGIRTVADGVEVIACTIEDCGRIDDPYGGGLMISTRGEVSITGCVIDGNAAATGAGIVCWNTSGTTRIEDCTITGNRAVTGAGVAALIRGDVEIVGSSLLENVASGRGGGVYCGIDGLSIVECVLAGNEALRGGALYGSGAAEVRDCRVTGNRSIVDG
ncbi:MAG: hypothetical protein GF346_01485, partial [Candidatus Eisenbacteria bacterium]|nr:hypothetical protein [Candidatus Latescibacterota bacterium]MBD3301102.1 hypothetical protein [Candidatus Eisenbacteria bacterium]